MSSMGTVSAEPEAVVIVGASAAGTATASKLRRLGYAGRLTIIGDEVVPYDRPPLSKQFLAGQWAEDKLRLMSPDQLESLDARLLLGTRAVGLDSGRRTITDDAGRTHPFDAAVIATGVRPRMLDALSAGRPHVLRTVSDATALRARLRPGTRLAVVGGGFLGLETAATALELGVDVVVVEPSTLPLSDRLGRTASARLVDLHRSRGTDFRLGVSVAGSSRDEQGVWTLELTDHSTVTAEDVLVAAGSVPQTDWLAGSGLDISSGVRCDAMCRAAPHVWAVGDIARWWDDRHQAHIRLEHRTNAIEQADVVAKGILGVRREAYRPVPFFWTDHFDARIQLAGTYSADLTETLIEIDSARESTITLFQRDDRLAAVLGWNAPREIQKYRRQLLLEQADRSKAGV
ncbi:NAD(P)/FAD-dependent oxidoreductase [Nocardioides sp. L-11A]|uniref:NAD(P)/FAD-dependent oxidoreductase n=1 Tax=Nocardioides sp. L-11A TaxID=3043848 RepID=UPI00249C23AA|nr:FAD-dependent oxidoreductase [Nocardioides sp. L-11A]